MKTPAKAEINPSEPPRTRTWNLEIKSHPTLETLGKIMVGRIGVLLV